MEALFLSSSSSSSVTASNKLARLYNLRDRCSLAREKKRVSLSWGRGSDNTLSKTGSGGFVNRPLWISSEGKERAKVLIREESSSTAAAMDADTLVLSPNGNGRTAIEINGAKSLVPFNGTASLVGLKEGLGIVNYLQGKSFFITGSTGFLAKVLIEKILRTAPDVAKIYLLIKADNREAAVERLKNEVLDAELFKILKEAHGPAYKAFMLSKLVPVTGNICDSDIGLQSDYAEEIARDVDVIINSAANTTFNERYDIALDINTRGPCNLMKFAKKCNNLKLFLQVSTAYVNGQRQGRIMEKPFSMGDCIETENFTHGTPFLDVEKEMMLASDAINGFQDHEEAQKMKDLGLERARTFGWQDTYVFTKAMGEMMINNIRGDVPVVIIRPSVIESTYRDPFPGWMEGNRMMDPIVLCYGKGQLTGFLVDPKGVLDVVPADMVVNATLAAIAKHGMDQEPEINVYQIASSLINPLIFEDLAILLYEHYKSSPCVDSKGTPIAVRLMKLFDSVDDFSDHLWKDAQERSGLTAMTSSDGKMMQKLEFICRKSVEQAKYLADIYEPYTFYGGRFDNSNMQRLMESMSEKEKREFGFDVGSIVWRDYITNVHIPGLRRHVLKGRA
ncbi:PREDICTED: fatty acyl-CoA reductase 2-like [Tarenaya hassleriana]|uniref:fatty acyl-CoA reductase 2-like n=1 Tax=Tarenaya hassleriana TaxID=28532 RepID=UPI00053C9CFB|nr:PREDICTED: fatty acyl-CoA reductase 2-like [Tarenaya hassleriana]XP_010520003.1 PREDICTED: fatty acyl-CoA reductase 2-like [Tarenaya hassleriana]XP_010520004.1 PREDICTED: fatty acyl-CoA reductase 2-like [Tarenaya hassleriana]XP_010520005.1 PREDICTED: fatty acyl-CoA reductase 2-like [Tarenaya hassleriana]XP_010520006.1 PREDICTED: fatty acyl-CoA reductase 2-like [Tarenaya hassleriana]XP_010520007.1 PREDICTED: fatty acyl-CoA reductase 2-like [Tarenaya hassleriana]XP_019056353.1 PREDICTED: fat